MKRVQTDLFGDAAGDAAPVGCAPAATALRALADELPDGLRLGTSSWSFPGWANLVYDRAAPQNVLARHGIGAYAKHPLLRTVSIDRSYYGPLDAARYADWAADVPPDFRFGVKIDRACVTPDLRPERGDRSLPNPYFLDPAYAAASTIEPARTGLGDRLGPFLLQFPPLPPDAVGGPRAFADALEAFLVALPRDILVGVELRSPALFTPRYAAVLAKSGAAHVYTVHPDMRPIADQLAALAPTSGRCLIVRWMLRPGLRYEQAKRLYEPFDRLAGDDPRTRATIARACAQALEAGLDAYVFINNKAEGSAPLSVLRLAEYITRHREEA